MSPYNKPVFSTTTMEVLDTLSQGVFVTDNALRLRGWNQWLVERTGRQADGIVGQLLADVLPELVARKAMQYYEDALRGEVRVLSQRFHNYFLPLPSKHFEHMPQSCRIAPLLAEGRVYGTITYIDDVTERTLRERELRARIADMELAYSALQESKEWLATTLRSIGDAVITADAKARITLMNSVAERLTGWTAEEAARQPFGQVFRIVNETTREPIPDPVAEVLSHGETLGQSSHTILLNKDGHEIPIDDLRTPIRNQRNEITGAVVVFRDVTERRRNEETLAQSEERFKLATRAAGDVIWDWDIESGRMWWSDAYESRFGERPDITECCASWWRHRIHPEDREAARHTSARAITGTDNTWNCEYRYARSDGSYADVLERAFIQRDGTGQAKRVIGAILDFSDRKASEREREQMLMRERTARKVAEDANRTKDEFLAVVSHELRTPLNAMLGWIRVLQLEQSPSKELMAKGLSVFERNVEIQAKLVDDLLDRARIISGKLRVDMQPVNLVAVIERTLDVVRPDAEAKNVRLLASLGNDITLVTGDQQRLQQIVWNLVCNAIKFTPNGGLIEVRLQHHGKNVEIQIKDSGLGIDPEFLPHVFDQFRQSDSSTTRRHAGLGLGLALVRSLVHLHGGEVVAESDGIGFGASFKVRLPAHESGHQLSERGDMETVAAVPDDSGDTTALFVDLAGLRVVLLEDNDDARGLLAEVFSQRGIDVQAFAEGGALLAWLEQTPVAQWPAALVCDIGLPDMDGYQVIQQIRIMEGKRVNRSHSKLPAIAVTAFARPEDRSRAMMAGYQSHMAKPLDPHELLGKLAALLAKQRRFRTNGGANPVKL